MPEQIEVYKFEELDEQAQEKAIEQEKERRQKGGMPFLKQDLKWKARSQIEEIDSIELEEIENLYYSLGYCQGDGVCLEADVIFTDEDNHEWYVKIRHSNSNYVHRHTMEVVSVEIYDWSDETDELEVTDDEWREWRKRASNICLDLMKGVAKELKKYGYDRIEEHQSEEQIRSEFEERHINPDRRFFEDGEEVNH